MTIFLKLFALVILLSNISSESFAKNNNETEITVTFNTELWRTIYLFLDNRLIKEVRNGDVIKFKVNKGKHLICATIGGWFGGWPDKCVVNGFNHIYKYDNVDLVWTGDGDGVWYRFYLSKEYNNEKIIALDDKFASPQQANGQKPLSLIDSLKEKQKTERLESELAALLTDKK